MLTGISALREAWSVKSFKISMLLNPALSDLGGGTAHLSPLDAMLTETGEGVSTLSLPAAVEHPRNGAQFGRSVLRLLSYNSIGG
jgi:hypothetical protein